MTVHLPDSIETDEWEVKMLLAAMLYQQGKATSGGQQDNFSGNAGQVRGGGIRRFY